jgi:hypothetical protein
MRIKVSEVMKAAAGLRAGASGPILTRTASEFRRESLEMGDHRRAAHWGTMT